MSDDNDPLGFGIPLPIPAEIAELLQKGHDRAHMVRDAAQARVDTFITSLDVDGLLAMRTILNQGDMSASPMANWWDGQLVAILRYVHHVDPDSGKDPMMMPDSPTS